MSETEKEPSSKEKRGFYAMVPRIVRLGYPKLSTSEKWLYVCLKDLCGDTGICYRSLSALGKETGLAKSSLSVMIRNLEEVKLIHAEKKKRNAHGYEVWHITIIDIWKQNKQFCEKPNIVLSANETVL